MEDRSRRSLARPLVSRKWIQLILVFLVTGAISSFNSVHADLIFSFTKGSELTALQGTNPGLANNVINGFIAAGNRWSGLFNDNVTVNVSINYAAMGSGILGSASSADFEASYGNTRTALTGDRTSTNDVTAVSNLPTGSALRFRTNDRTGAVIFDQDGSRNNNTLSMTTANAKALGLLSGTATGQDASITFSSNFGFDFNPADGITAGLYDFIGVATHEIGHALGFVSGVDIVDYYSGPNGPGKNADLSTGLGIGTLDPFAIFAVLDLYRYSTASLALGAGVLDLAYAGSPYFSINGGSVSGGAFSTGAYNGNGRQASHWKDNLGLGIMDPTFASGELGVISSRDVLALDVMGWNLTTAHSPEPGSAVLFLVGMTGLTLRLWHSRRKTGSGGTAMPDGTDSVS